MRVNYRFVTWGILGEYLGNTWGILLGVVNISDPLVSIFVSTSEFLVERWKPRHAQEEKFQFEEKLHKTKLELQTQLQASQIKGSEQPLTPKRRVTVKPSSLNW